MRSRTTQAFRKALESLPSDIRDRARDAFRRFEDDPQHPSLRFRQVHPSRSIYSARVSLEYRALAIRHDDEWIWFWIGSHADYDALLRRM